MKLNSSPPFNPSARTSGSISLQAHFGAKGLLERRANSSPPFQRSVPSKSHLTKPIQINRLLRRRANSSPPFYPLDHVTASLSLVARPKQRVYSRRDEQTLAPLSTLSTPLQHRCLSVTRPKQRVYRRGERTQAPLSTLDCRGEDLLGTLQRPPSEPASVPSGSFRPSPHTVGNPAPMVPGCPFAQKG